MNTFFRAVDVVERRYIFLKRLCQVLCALGGQLCSLVVNEFDNISIPVFTWPFILAMNTFCVTSYKHIFYVYNVFSPQGSDVEVEVPANLSKYIEALLAFTTHSSQVRFFSDGFHF